MAIERSLILLGLLGLALNAETVRLPGLKQPVEILRDRWGVPHVYAQNAGDLFFANGYINARDRLFQIDLWRRIGTGKLAEAVGPSAVERDRLARLFIFRGDWNAEWQSYSPDARSIVTAFANGVNAYIKSLNGNRPVEFRQGGYDPGLWTRKIAWRGSRVFRSLVTWPKRSPGRRMLPALGWRLSCGSSPSFRMFPWRFRPAWRSRR